MSAEKIMYISGINRDLLNQYNLLVCNASAVRCKDLLDLTARLQNGGLDTIVVMPEDDLQKGTSGYAKAQILAALPGVKAVVATTDFSIKKILFHNGENVVQLGPIIFSHPERVEVLNSPNSELSIPTTTSETDKKFMDDAKSTLKCSDCWWSPTACVIVKNSVVIARAASGNSWKSGCYELNISPSDISLKKGERIGFCDAIHAERRVIAQAAKEGIVLDKSCMYITKFPCDECMKVMIDSGIRKLVFEEGSYGLKDAQLLIDNGVEITRIQY